MNDLLINKDHIDEVCSVCGRKLTRYGNKKLKDGILCRTCVAISSSWYTDDIFLNKTIDDIKKHIKYRKNNHKLLNDFNKDIVVEGKYSLYIDEDNKKFLFSKNNDFNKENPDIFSLNEIEEIRIVEEDYINENGVDLLFEMDLNNKEIENISFRINEFPNIEKNSEEHNKSSKLSEEFIETINKSINLKEVKEEIDEQ